MTETSASFETIVFTIGNAGVSLGQLLVLATGLLALLIVIFGVIYSRANNARRAAEMAANDRAQQADSQLSDILKAQSEMHGRMAAMSEMFGTRQSEFNQAINQRLDGMTQRIGVSITEQTKSTHENLARLQERLAVIDTAQNNIQTLARDVVGLQAILSNKQTRGAFGQSRMETIVKDGLPFGSYRFQPTLSNGNRPDCTVTMPNDSPDLVIDAKFPLEAWNAMRETDVEDAAALAQASQRFRRDMEVHIRDISEKYLIPGETQDTAFLFVPSESIFAEIHENFETIVQRAHRARVVIVSPSLMMLSVQVVQALLKDARMREQAHLIQHEVIRLMEDLTRLDDRVRKLQSHFGQAQKDIDQILTSTDKLAKRGNKIEMMEFSATEIAEAEKDGPEGRAGKLRLHVVDEDGG